MIKEEVMQDVIQLFKKSEDENLEICFNIGIKGGRISAEEMKRLKTLLADGFIIETVKMESMFSSDDDVVEIGPRLSIATPWSSNLISICKIIGLDMIFRVEKSRRYRLLPGTDREAFIAANHDRMRESVYSAPLDSFELNMEREETYFVPLMEEGPDALLRIPGISMDEQDRQFYYDYFVVKHKRNPTIVEIMDLNNANCEHSRHGFFKGIQIIDGKTQKYTLFEVVMDPLKKGKATNSVIAFHDNSSVIWGHPVWTIIPENPGHPSSFVCSYILYHPLLTAETHNFPTGVAPFPGAETGTGGRIRDVQGTGKGGSVIAGTAGYCVGSLNIPGYPLPWEKNYPCPDDLAIAGDILLQASSGASDYGNKFGEPLIAGFCHSIDLYSPDGDRWAYLKPIMFTGGVGQIDDRHTEKSEPEKGMWIVQVGGPAYRVGFGGGASSSKEQGEQASELDFSAVQRGDAEMEQRMNRVIRACNEMGDKTLIDVIHDQGAGGPGNVLKELVEKTGGRIKIRNINVADSTMSDLEVFVAEYQERNGFLIREENLEPFKAICEREKVECEVLGQVTDDLRFVVEDADGNLIVDIELDVLLGGIPQKTFVDNHVDYKLEPWTLPMDIVFLDALVNVLKLVSVGSKRFLTKKGDRSVGGLVVRQQCCGPLQLPISDVAVVAQSHFSLSGIATAIGEQPLKMLVNPAAGARMAVGEALTNLMGARISDIGNVKCSANWMWAAKLPGEGAAIRDAAEAMSKVMISLGIAPDGGKDSLSMVTHVGKEKVKSPRELVISLYCDMLDITKTVTPDIKRPGESMLVLLDLSGGKNRMGGSALAQSLGQIGDKSPDLDDPGLVKRVFEVAQSFIDKDLLLSIHDRSGGGLITTLLEMAFAGNCGLDVNVSGNGSEFELLFSEELGVVLECASENWAAMKELLSTNRVPFSILGNTEASYGIKVRCNDKVVLDEDMRQLRQSWEETSHQLELLRINPQCAKEEKRNIYDRVAPKYHIPFVPGKVSDLVMKKFKVAILREEGSNSDREMTSAFYMAGFDPYDVTMSDLLAGRINLDQFRGLVAVGGFSYADVPESAKGWAATILFNETLNKMFTDFYNRPDTFTLGVCNGCQLFGLLGLVPWKGIAPKDQPRFVRNVSGHFESAWSTVKVLPSPAIMLRGMEGLTFGIHVDHGDGQLVFPLEEIYQEVVSKNLITMAYVDDQGNRTEKYPLNPNGSILGSTGLCSPDGRHLAVMPHPERTFLPWQCHWLPEEMRKLEVSPWFKMFQNAYAWCDETK